MLATNAAPAPPAGSALRHDATYMRANLGEIDDKLLVVGDILDGTAAARAALERLEDLFVDVIGDRLVGTNVSSLAAGLASVLLAKSSRERCRLPLRGAQRLSQLPQQILDLLLQRALLLDQLVELTLLPLELLLKTGAPRSLLLQEAFELSS
jgi:hypothetical protein